MDARVVRLNPFGSEAFGHHILEGKLDSWTNGHRITDYIKPSPGGRCGGLLEIFEPGDIIVRCNSCDKQMQTGKTKDEFMTFWALMSLQVHYAKVLENVHVVRFDYRRQLPELISIDEKDRSVRPVAFIWRRWLDLALAALDQLDYSNPPKDWEAFAIFEIIRALKEIHGTSLSTAKETIEQALADAHSAFGWLYP